MNDFLIVLFYVGSVCSLLMVTALANELIVHILRRRKFRGDYRTYINRGMKKEDWED